MTEPPLPPGNVPPPPGSYPPPPPGYYPPPGAYPPPPAGYYPPMAGQPGMLPKEAYTSWITRVAAYAIDVLPAALLIGIGQLVMFSTAKNDCLSESTDSSYSVACTSQPTGLGLTVSILCAFAALAYGIWNYGYRQGTTGSSIGKSVMKFRVVGEKTGQPIGFGMSILRQLAHVVDGLICNLGYLFPLWDAKRQTLADKIMSTVCLPR